MAKAAAPCRSVPRVPGLPGLIGGSVRDRQKISASSWRLVRLVPGIDGWRRVSLLLLPREVGQTSGRPLHPETGGPAVPHLGCLPSKKTWVMRPELRRHLWLHLVGVTRVCTRWSPNLASLIS